MHSYWFVLYVLSPYIVKISKKNQNMCLVLYFRVYIMTSHGSALWLVHRAGARRCLGAGFRLACIFRVIYSEPLSQYNQHDIHDKFLCKLTMKFAASNGCAILVLRKIWGVINDQWKRPFLSDSDKEFLASLAKVGKSSPIYWGMNDSFEFGSRLNAYFFLLKLTDIRVRISCSLWK